MREHKQRLTNGLFNVTLIVIPGYNERPVIIIIKVTVVLSQKR